MPASPEYLEQLRRAMAGDAGPAETEEIAGDAGPSFQDLKNPNLLASNDQDPLKDAAKFTQDPLSGETTLGRTVRSIARDVGTPLAHASQNAETAIKQVFDPAAGKKPVTPEEAKKQEETKKAEDASEQAANQAVWAPQATQDFISQQAPMLIPAHTVQTVDPARYEEMVATFGPERAAMMARGEAEQRYLETQAAGEHIKRALLDKQRQEIQDKAKERYRALVAQEEQIDRLSEEASNMKEDPERWWHSRETWQKVLFGVSAALGGFVQGMRGGPNVGLEQINRNIDRDLQAQRSEIEAKRGRVGDLKGLLAESYRRFGNMEQAEQAARLIALQQVESVIREFSAIDQRDIAKANADLMLSKTRQDQVRIKASMEHRIQASLAGGTGGATVDDSRLVELPDGETRIAPSSEEGAKLRARAGIIERQRELDTEAVALREAIAQNPTDPQNIQRYKQLQGLADDATALWSTGSGQGVLREGEYPRAIKHIANYTSVNPITFKATNQAIIHGAQRRDHNFVAEVNAIAPERGVRVHVPGKKGMVPGGFYTGQTARTGAGPNFQLIPPSEVK